MISSYFSIETRLPQHETLTYRRCTVNHPNVLPARSPDQNWIFNVSRISGERVKSGQLPRLGADARAVDHHSLGRLPEPRAGPAALRGFEEH